MNPNIIIGQAGNKCQIIWILNIKFLSLHHNHKQMEKEYSIKITGGGTFAGIMNALHSIADEMDLILESGQTPPDNIEWEDPILMTEITEDEK